MNNQSVVGVNTLHKNTLEVKNILITTYVALALSFRHILRAILPLIYSKKYFETKNAALYLS